MSTPSVAIVILNWNGKMYLSQFLPSVISTTYPNLRIIVADNASTDDSIAFLQSDFPQIELIRLEKNFGFAGGYNIALEKVDADYFVLLNSDVEVTSGWLEPIINLLEEDERNAACQPKLLDYNRKNYFEYAGGAGGWLDIYGYPFARGRIFDDCEEDHGQYDTTEEVFWASGAAMVIKSSLYKKAGGFDEFLFAHQEEIDLCWRLKLDGYRIFCCPRSVVYHVGGGTLPRSNSMKTFLNFRNNQVILAKNLPWHEKWWKIPYRMGLDQVSALKELLTGHGGYFVAVIRGHLAFIRWIIRGRKKMYPGKRKKLSQLSGVYKRNIVWDYFVRKKKKFEELGIAGKMVRK